MKTSNQSPPSYVYFILDRKSNAIKIGKANDIADRLSTLQTGNPNILEVLNFIECNSSEHSFVLEGSFHDKFQQLHINGEWFFYDEQIFSDFFESDLKFENKPKRKPLTRSTLFGEEVIFDVKTHPRCFFYPHQVAQILESYENSSKRKIPFRVMSYPTDGKCMLLPFSDSKNRVFISNKKHEENMKLRRYELSNEKTHQGSCESDQGCLLHFQTLAIGND